MPNYIGIDTSNYTTSVALSSDGRITHNLRTILDVKKGERGLRQSDAVFSHTVNLPKLFEKLGRVELCAVGASYAPRDAEGSYMPCFLSGIAVATALSASNGIPLFKFSHQAGHIAAALYSLGREELLNKEFIAFHVSGGTTEVVHFDKMDITLLGGTRDISAGKLIDRAGVLLGLKFPCGKELEALAGNGISAVKAGKLCVNGFDCNLSGIENKVKVLISQGAERQYIAAYVISFVNATILKITENVISKYGDIPIIYSGGVMSNRYISSQISKKHGGLFAMPEYSCDNASGIARLAELKYNGVI